MNPAVYALNDAPARSVGAVVTPDGGVPRQRFVKEAVRAGRWVMPGGNAVTVTSDRLNGWVETFEAMRQAGVGVKLMSGHTNESEKTRGDVLNIFPGKSADGSDALFAIVEAVGEDAIKEVLRNDVSIYAAPFTDGTGRKWDDALQHIALTPIPVVPGQSAAVPIAASRGGTNEVPVLRLSQEKHMFDWKPVAAALSLGELTDETAGPAILAKIGELTKLPESVKTLEAQVAAMSRDKAPEVDPDALEIMAEATFSRTESLVEKGCISPDQKKELDALLCGTAEKRPAVMLSRTAAKAAGHSDAMAKGILAIFEKNKPAKPVQPGQKTNAQGVALSRDDKADPTGFDKDTHEAMRAMAYGRAK